MKLRSLSIALLAGAVGGALATHLLTPGNDYSRFSETVPVLELDKRRLSNAEAEQLRAARYEQIRNIDDVLALPSYFSRSEALFTLAGRSDSGKVQDLLYQLAGVADNHLREPLLAILFARLTELDPKSALAISRSPAFTADERVEQRVWAHWARYDLVAAVEAASDSDAALRHRAAQGLYLGIDEVDGADAVFIANALGIDPGIDARSRHLRRLVAKSDDAAIAFIETVTSPLQRQSLIAEFARLVAERVEKPGDTQIGTRFASRRDQRTFTQMSAIYGAQINPEETLAALFAAPDGSENQQKQFAALMQLASQDAERALQIVDEIQDPKQKAEFMRFAIMAVAQVDPQRTLEWARQQDQPPRNDNFLIALSQIAQTDPQLALAEAQSLKSGTDKDRLIGRIGRNMAATNPAVALDIVDGIDNATQRASSTARVLVQWAQTDFDSAMNWLDALDEETRASSLSYFGEQLAERDVDSAIRLIERFPNAETSDLSQRIVSQIAQKRGLGEAQAYLERYRGTPQFASMQYSAITAAARRDADAAMLVASRLEEGSTRDRAISSIIGTKAAEDPRAAMQWLTSISDADRRVAATGRIAKSWYRSDPTGAETWINIVQDQETRDELILSLAAQGASDEMLASMSDPEKRKSAMLVQVQTLARRDPVRAEQLLNKIDLSDAEKTRYMQILDEASSR